MARLFEQLKNFCVAQGFAKTYWIAYSGGLDSHVLLHLCVKLREQYPLQCRAVYINHGLSPQADNWAKHCANICLDLHVDFMQKTIQVPAVIGKSPEEMARQGRYAVLAELLSPGDCLLTAHQLDDQAETVLLQLLRGAGPKGLAGMPSLKPLGSGWHGRPWLEIERQEIRQYAELLQLQWIEDGSNLNVAYTRNFLRHEIVPLLRKRWPSINHTLARVAENCAQVQHLIDAVAGQDLRMVKNSSSFDKGMELCSKALVEGDTFLYKKSQADRQKKPKLDILDFGNGPHEQNKQNLLSIHKLLLLDPLRQRQTLRAWFKELKYPLPSSVKMQQIQQNFLMAANDKSPHIIWGDIELRRYKNNIYAMQRLGTHDVNQDLSWNLHTPLVIPNLGILNAVLKEGMGLRADIKQVSVRFRQGGELCYLPGRAGHHKLKNLFQEWGVPPWERERVPLLYVNDKLVAVVGFFMDPECVEPKAGQGAWCIRYNPNKVL